MNSLDAVHRLRMKGKMPKIVFVNDYPCYTAFDGESHFTVCTHEQNIDLMDLRWAVGLTVSIGSESKDRAQALFERFKDAGCNIIGACEITDHPQNKGAWATVWRKNNV